MNNPDAEVAVWTCVADQAERLCKVGVPFETLEERTGLSLGEIEHALDELSIKGLVTSWNPGPGPVATLTPFAAHSLGLKLRPSSARHGGLNWMPLGRPDPKARRPRPRKILSMTDLDLAPDQLAGTAPRPDQIAEAREQLEATAPKRGRRLSDRASDRLPWPTVILTGSCTFWDESTSPPFAIGSTGDHLTHDSLCPACKSLPLSPAVSCLRCGRWGLDWLLDRIRQAERVSEAMKALPPPKSFAHRHSPAEVA